MSKMAFLSIVTGVLSLAFLTSCEGKQHVLINSMVDDVITQEGMISILNKHGLEIPPDYIPTPGASIRAVVIPVDINTITGGERYDEVRVTVTLFKREGNSAFITGVPQSVNRQSSVEERSTVAGNFAAAASEITKEISSITFDAKLERTITETYPKLYQTVGFNIRPPSLVWTFAPFKTENIPTGTYYIFALIDVRDPTRGLQIEAHSSCKYKAPVLFGLFEIPLNCKPDYEEYDLVPTAQAVLVQTAPPVAPESTPTLTPEPTSTLTPSPTITLPSEEIVLVFGGWPEIREAVLDAVDWPSLLRDRNVNLIFKDLEGEQIDISSRGRDLARCQQFLAGYPYGNLNLSIMILPGSEALTQTAEALGAYLADCGIGTSIEKIDSTVAYQKLMTLSAAGQAGMLLSLQVQE